eukprot:jgi/Hompol1/2792/HPOL_000384-RA
MRGLYRTEHAALAVRAAAHFSGREVLPVTSDTELIYVTDRAGSIVSIDDSNWNDFVRTNTDLELHPHQSLTATTMQLAEGVQPRFRFQWFCDGPDVERKMLMTVCKLSRETAPGADCHLLWISKTLEEIRLSPTADFLSAESCDKVSDADRNSRVTRTVCSFCKRILVSASEVNSALRQRKLLECELAAHASILPFQATPDVPVIGMRGKIGQALVLTPESSHASPYSSGSQTLEPSPMSNTADTPLAHHMWLTPAEFYSSEFSGDSDKILINHGMCEVCYQEIANYFQMVPMMQKQQRQVHSTACLP